ncbi:Lon protease S16, partial [Helicosporidium sp. ATCC 50920]
PAAPPLPAANWDIHVHFPAGGVPKDGPSAGVTLAVALVSLLAGRAARPDTAMTGELTLRGLVLPVGGLDQKVAAAHASGLRRVLVPRRNLADVLAEVPAHVRAGLEVLPCDNLHQVLELAFDPPMRAAEHAVAKA